ncbi:MAG: hypothetical protein GVY36_04970 [Verrucomicrobia bacterium]|jgi:REP element-mobilizing transposase RayT|nr:hypothetical protein [Verrucomicrobiota bacterium]
MKRKKANTLSAFRHAWKPWLDAGHGDCILAEKSCASIVDNALKYFDGERYNLGAYVVASNHVHVLVTPLGDHALSEIIHSWKSYTANELNKHLGRSGQIWQKEYYDHILRSANAAYRIAQYILQHSAAKNRLEAASTVAAASSRSESPKSPESPESPERQDAAPTYLTRWDGHTFKKHPVTGEDVPDESVTIPVYQYTNPRPATWPQADYIVGNPPFIGTARMRDALGDGYTETLRKTYSELPESIDLVMFWWHKAAELARAGKVKRFGLITTNSLRQTFNRRVLQRHMQAKDPLSLRFAVADHPWVENADGAAVRIAMTVAQAGSHSGELAEVVDEYEGDDGSVGVALNERVGIVHADLTIGADLGSAQPMLANTGVSSRGHELGSAGFIVNQEDLDSLGFKNRPDIEKYLREYRNGKDLAQRPRNVWVIDLFGMTAEQTRELYPELYQRLHDRVKADRAQNRDKRLREQWWLHRRSREDWRDMLKDLPRYIATVETSKHRFFQFLDASILPDNKLVAIAHSDAWMLGVLSSRVHVAWAMANRSNLGVGNDPVYVKTRCFETFPFPELNDAQKAEIGNIAEKLDAHRKRQLEGHPKLTMTGLYNVLEKVRSEATLTPKEKTIYDDGLVAVLRELHDELDAAVLAAYGWEDIEEAEGFMTGGHVYDFSTGEIAILHVSSEEQFRQVMAEQKNCIEQELLTRLVELNRQRTAEEAQGKIRWLRPEYQKPEDRGQKTETQSEIDTTAQVSALSPQPSAKLVWPSTVAEQAAAVRSLIRQTGWTSDQDIKLLAQHFKGVRAPKVQAIADALVALGQAA